MTKIAVYTMVGFSVGAVVGFIWAGETKKGLADNIKSEFASGKLTIVVDAKSAALDGIKNIL